MLSNVILSHMLRRVLKRLTQNRFFFFLGTLNSYKNFMRSRAFETNLVLENLTVVAFFLVDYLNIFYLVKDHF